MSRKDEDRDALLEDNIETLAIYCRKIGVGRVVLDGLQGDQAFGALCRLGATVVTETSVAGRAEYVTEVARLRLQWVEMEVRLPARQVARRSPRRHAAQTAAA